MTSGLGKTLPIQARDLLDQHSKLLQRPGGAEQIRSKALECHSKMLEFGELQRSEAIEHALAGAELLVALHGHPCYEPDWVAVHEEQCCRHGALWVQAAFNERETAQTIAWGHQALVLLDRLQQLLNPQPTWVKLLRLELRDRLKELSPELFPGEQNSLSIVLVGNCQAFPLLLGLRNGLPQASITYSNSVHLATAADVARLHQALPTADVLVTHRVQPGYRDNIGLDSNTLNSLLAPSARCLVMPNLHYEGQLPWCGYGHDPDGRLAELEAESPLGPYQDFLAMAAADLGIEADDLLNQPCPEGVTALLRIAHQSSLAELQSREDQCSVQISDWIAEHHRHQPIGHTINHPTQACLHELLLRLLGQLDPEHQLGPDPFDGQDPLGSLSLPIHPWVQQALKLGSWASSWGQRETIPFKIQAQLAESIAFYRLHPWIAAANADHPKLTFAMNCLGFLPRASPKAGSQADQTNKADQPINDSPPSLFDAIWVSKNPGDALRKLAHHCWNQANAGDHGALDTFIQACSLSADEELIAMADPLVRGMPLESPWRAFYTLLLQIASHAPQDQLGRSAQVLVSHAQHLSAQNLRLIATSLSEDGSPASQHALSKLLPYLSEIDQILAQVDQKHQVKNLLKLHPNLDSIQVDLCTRLYTACEPSIRGHWHEWSSPCATTADILNPLIQRIKISA